MRVDASRQTYARKLDIEMDGCRATIDATMVARVLDSKSGFLFSMLARATMWVLFSYVTGERMVTRTWALLIYLVFSRVEFLVIDN